MSTVRRFFQRYLLSTAGSLLLFLAVNLALLLSVLFAGFLSGDAAGVPIRTLSGHITRQSGVWTADETAQALLREGDSWAMLLDAGGDVVWEQSLPEALPRAYTSAQIASFSRWYLRDYPVQVWAREDGSLLVTGSAPGSWVKLYFSIDTPSLLAFLTGIPVVFVGNLALLAFLVLWNARRVEAAMSPILQGIQTLSQGSHRPLPVRGPLAEIDAALNQAGERLLQKDNTRAEWIRGVSHDIRTPLSTVLGYASELAENPALPAEARRQAFVIRKQSERMKALVEDLNLTTRLEYALHPLHPETVDLAELCRQAVCDVLNDGLPEAFTLDFSAPEGPVRCTGDPALLRRMTENLLRNCMVHNPEGCRIRVTVVETEDCGSCTVADDGRGMDEALLQSLRGPLDAAASPPGEHGLGLRLVRQIVKAHGGTVYFEPAAPHGLCVTASFPLEG